MSVSKILDNLTEKEYEQLNDTIILDMLINNVRNMISDEDVKATLFMAFDKCEVLLNEKTQLEIDEIDSLKCPKLIKELGESI